MNKLELRINLNGDPNQVLGLFASSRPALQDKLESAIRRQGVHSFDGATLGSPDEGHPHVSIVYVEGCSDNYAWEIHDNRNPNWHLRPHPLDYVEAMPLEEAFHQWCQLALEFAEHNNNWPEYSWS